MKPQYSLRNNAFAIDRYHAARAFSSFLPGISGLFGKPMWVFYTNRGQCIASFGVRNKNGAMLEFYPANKAYAVTPLMGFRTFIRVKKGSKIICYEPFRVNAEDTAKQTLFIRPHEIELEETNTELGIRVRVVYFNAPNETLPILVRQVRIDNLRGLPFKGEIVDGLPQIVPFGLNETLLKHMSRTMEAFAEVPHLEDRLPFFKLKTEPSDKPEVQWIQGGFFTFSRMSGERLGIIVDPDVIFGTDTSFQTPYGFCTGKPISLQGQRTESTFASAFSYAPLKIASKGFAQLCSFYGQADAWPEALAFRERVEAHGTYGLAKREENAAVIAQVTDAFATHSSSPALDAYSQQTYLDNVLRGGQPILFQNGSHAQIYHAYSRKHGDMERDYNFFEVAPSYFSQGNGNFRDVNQNRRAETMLHVGVGASNVETFFNLLQLDGFNPLVFQYEKYLVKGKYVRPGDLFEKLLASAPSREDAYKELSRQLAGAPKIQDASHGEGFWVDHWTYNLDLLENFNAVYPDQLKTILVDKKDFTFYDNDHAVRPRDKKYVLREDGAVRQMHAVGRDHAKARMLRSRKEDPHKVRTKGGSGHVYHTTLLAKILGLITVKAASLDPFGIGIEMEAEKPGWCDALNGLPGLLGSSLNESLELRRWVDYVQKALPRCLEKDGSVMVAKEIAEFLKAVKDALSHARPDDFYRTWDTLTSLKENFRHKTLLGLSGDEKSLSRRDIDAFLEQVAKTLAHGLAKATRRDGLCTTYFINEVTEYEKLPLHARSEDSDVLPIQYVRALRFKQTPISPFLEGPMHALRVLGKPEAARKLYHAVKNSELYDRKLKMYKLNVPLTQESYEIGRNKIFTPGWLENESIFLHMHYKFLFELLRAGLAREFFDEMKHGIVAFLNPEVYGRSTSENSSFIASSRFPDARLHGAGFVARLSGSTAEWLSMVFHMGLGAEPFKVVGDHLRFEPKPILAGWLFSNRANGVFEKGTFAFKLFGKTWIVLHNRKRNDIFENSSAKVRRFKLETQDGQSQTHEGHFLPEREARALRDGRYARVDIELG